MAAPPPDGSPAQEVRVSVYAHRALRRWYVIVLTIIVAIGLVVLQGAAATKGRTTATATVYMGQPVTPAGGGLFANPPYANLSAVDNLISSGGSKAKAAAAAGVSVSSLDGNLAAHQLSSGGGSATTKAVSGPAYYSIVAEGPWSKKAAGIIANTLAKIVADRANGYVNAKISGLTANIANEHAVISRLSKSVQIKQTLALSLAKDAANDASKAALVATLLAGVTSDSATITATQTQLSTNQTALASAVNIESATITTPGAGHNVTAQHKRSSLLVAAFVGLIVGVLLALAWDAIARRRAGAAGSSGESTA
jgi:hypothetical protein